MPERLFTVRDVAALWRCSTSKVYRLIASGQLRANHIGGVRDTRVSESAIDEFLKAQREPTGRPTLTLVHDASAVA